jgi:hypothetical protein
LTICSVKGPWSMTKLNPFCFGLATTVSKCEYLIQLDQSSSSYIL